MPQPQLSQSSEDEEVHQASGTASDDIEAAGAVIPEPENATPTPLLGSCKLRGPQPPPVNPLKFIKVTPPTNLYKAPPQREQPIVERIRKEEPEAWQNDLEGWKSSRRKRQEQLMERVTEIKKMEGEQHNPNSRRNKTFSEMMKGRKSSIVVYNDESEMDFSDLGLGSTSQEANDDGKNHELTVVESEFTYEKAIQNYVEFASSRVSKPNAAANTSEEELCDKSFTAKEPQQQSPMLPAEFVPVPASTPAPTRSNSATPVQDAVISLQTHSVESHSSDTTNGVIIQETTSVLQKISVFENCQEPAGKSPLKPKEKICSPIKKLGPPVSTKLRGGPLQIEEQQQPKAQLERKASTPQVVAKEESSQNTSWQHDISSKSPAQTESKVDSLHAHEFESMQAEIEPNFVLSDDMSSGELELPQEPKLLEVAASTSSLDQVTPRDILRSPLGGEDSGVHTADSVSQSDEVEEDEELPPQNELEVPSGLLSILSSQVPIVDHELSALLAPPARLKPPREKPPPPPPVGVEPDTEIMRKNFLGLEVTPKEPPRPIAEPTPAPNHEDNDTLGNQLKERLLKLEEEKNNILKMEKHLQIEKQFPPPHPVAATSSSSSSAPAPQDDAGAQENLALEREALRIERDAVATRKHPSFAKKLAVKSLESLTIPPLQEALPKEEPQYYEPKTVQHVAAQECTLVTKPVSTTVHRQNVGHKDLMQPVEKSMTDSVYQQPAAHKLEHATYETTLEPLSEPHGYHKHAIAHVEELSPQLYPPKQKSTPVNEAQHYEYQQEQQQQKLYVPSNDYVHQQSYEQTGHQQVEYCQRPPQLSKYYIPPSPRYDNSPYNDGSSYSDQSMAAEAPAVMQSNHHSPGQGAWAKISQKPQHPQQVPQQPKQLHPQPHSQPSQQLNYIPPGPPIRKKGPPPPAKPSRIMQQQKHSLTRNRSADSILESVEGGSGVVLRRSKEGTSGGANSSNGADPSGRSSLYYNLGGGSMSQLPSSGCGAPSSVAPQPRQRPVSTQGINYQHWLLQEAEHRRITEQQQRQSVGNQRQPKHLPDAIIMSLTQRVQQRQSQGTQQRTSPQRTSPQRNSPQRPTAEDKVLSVSGKKKCSHCNLELGRGAAMIIESLRLFYHIDCFKCCVCCIQLGDGLMGTDVRVRNGKLHCHSCYSSDDGVKFSCV